MLSACYVRGMDGQTMGGWVDGSMDVRWIHVLTGWMHGFDKAIRILSSKQPPPIETENWVQHTGSLTESARGYLQDRVAGWVIEGGD